MSHQRTSANEPIPSAHAGDAGLMDLVREYVAGLCAETQEMHRLLATGDRAALARAAHRLRGTGGTYGYAVITEICGRIEDAARGGRAPEVIHELVGELLRLVPRITAGLANGG